MREDPLIGRARERDALCRAVARGAEGGPVFLLVVGEPGIGKTTLLGSLQELATDAGFSVGYERGKPEGAAPLWPWASALGAIDGHRRDAPGRDRSTRPQNDAVPTLDGGAERFAVFERFAADLERHAEDGPVALVVDDLQWADVSTLRLFRHLLDRPSRPGALIAGGLRTTEPLAAEASEVVSGLLAHPSVEVIEVASFSESEIAAFADSRLDRPARADEVAVLARRSGGNPFLLGELLRWVPTAGSAAELDAALPLAVRESVRRRLVVEDPVTQEVVKAAAVAASAASLDLLTAVTGIDRAEVSGALDAAGRAGLLVVESNESGSILFAHDLVRQAVLTLLPTWDQTQLHYAVGMALRDDVRSSSWAVVAAHLAAARPLADEATLFEVAKRAAVEAARAGAFDEAAAHLDVALRLTGDDGTERGRLLLERGRALWAAERAEESTATLADAVGLARRRGDGELLARVALSWRGGELRAILRHPDQRFLALLREALATCPAGDSRLRCLLLARLARCATWDIGDRDALAAADDAVAMARRLGGAEELVSALGTRFYYAWRPEMARERLGLADEMLDAAVMADEAGLIAEASYFRLVALLDLGRLHDAWTELDRFEGAVVVSGQPLARVRALWLRATCHLARGERSQADQAAAEARRLAQRLGRPDAAVEWLGQSLVVLAAEDRVDEALELFGTASLRPVTYNSVAAIGNGIGGRPAEAGTALQAVARAGLDRHPHDMMWLFGRCGLLTAAVVSGDRDTAELLHDELEPFAGHWAVLNPGIVVAGTVDHYLGLGAASLGRQAEAAAHLRQAAEAHEREGAVTLALLSLHELRTVLERSADGDAAEIELVDRRVALLAGRNTVPFKPLLRIMWSGPDATPVHPQQQRLVLEGDTWLVEFGGRRARLRDQRGLHHLRALLERPGVEIPALMLAAADGGLAAPSEGRLLDERAMREYRRRIDELRDDIDDATANNDIERAAKAEAELDVLVRHLASATGIGRRPRQFSGADERARVSVTKAIRAAINHLGEQLPELGRHLTTTVRTGSRCVYLPDPRAPHTWTTERL